MYRELIIEATRHHGGLKMQPCLAVDPAWFADIQSEVQLLLQNRAASDVNQQSHPTYWTKPYGGVTQHSLLNESGNTADCSTDHNVKVEGKTFAAPEYRSLRELASIFEGKALNFRMNGLMAKSGLSPHEENIVHDGGRLRLRFHLPLFTNPEALVQLDGEQFALKPGYIYFFNNGAVHAAANLGDKPRYHFVWDIWFDDWSEEYLLNLRSSASPHPKLRKLTEAEAADLSVSTPWIINQYVDSKGNVVHVPQQA